MTDVIQTAYQWHQEGRRIALASVVSTWGSAPRAVGAQMVIDDHMRFEGSVSGGCVEGAVIAEALDALRDGRVRVLDYSVSDGDAFAVGLACGGRIKILVQPVGGALPVTLLGELAQAIAARQPIAYRQALDGGTAQRCDASACALQRNHHVQSYAPPLRMVIVGAVHIAQALVPMAQACGHAPVVIDPRPAFAHPARFVGIDVIADWPGDAVEALGLDARSSLIALTHDPKIDDPALRAALRSPAFYIGALGSTRSHAQRCDRLAQPDLGQDQETGVAHGGDRFDLGRIDGPVGVPIGARGPAEIAVSIMAAVIRAARQPDGPACRAGSRRADR